MILSNGVSGIGDYAFLNCESLAELIIPQSVTYMGMAVTNGCSNLTIYAETESLPRNWDSEWNLANRPVEWGYKQTN